MYTPITIDNLKKEPWNSLKSHSVKRENFPEHTKSNSGAKRYDDFFTILLKTTTLTIAVRPNTTFAFDADTLTLTGGQVTLPGSTTRPVMVVFLPDKKSGPGRVVAGLEVRIDLPKGTTTVEVPALNGKPAITLDLKTLNSGRSTLLFDTFQEVVSVGTGRYSTAAKYGAAWFAVNLPEPRTNRKTTRFMVSVRPWGGESYSVHGSFRGLRLKGALTALQQVPLLATVASTLPEKPDVLAQSPKVKEVSLEALEVILSKKAALQHVSAQVALISDTKWTLVQGAFTVTALQVRVSVNCAHKPWTPSWEVGGQAELFGKVVLRVTVTATGKGKDVVVGGSLTTITDKSAQKALAERAAPHMPGGDGLKSQAPKGSTAVVAQANVTAKTFRVDIELGAEATVAVDSVRFTDLSMQLCYGSQSTPTTITVAGEACIDRHQVSVRAHRSSSSGWQLSADARVVVREGRTSAPVAVEELFLGGELTRRNNRWRLTASAEPREATVGVRDVATALGVTTGEWPEELLGVTAQLTRAEIAIDFADKAVVVLLDAVISSALGRWPLQILLGSGHRTGNVGARVTAILAHLGLEVRLSALPVVGPVLPTGVDAGVSGLHLAATTAALDKTAVTTLAGLTPGTAAIGFSAHDRAGARLRARIHLATTTRWLEVRLSSTKKPPSEETEVAITQAAGITPRPASPHTPPNGPAAHAVVGVTAWAELDARVGPLRVRRVGFGYAGGTVELLLDADVTVAGLTVQATGLGIVVPLTSPFRIYGRLSGLGAQYARPPVQVGAALLVQQPPPTGYRFAAAGLASLGLPTVTAQAVAYYAHPDGPGGPSLFVYGTLGLAAVKAVGPPQFRVTKFAAGFGYNSRVREPTMAQVREFPLLALLVDGSDSVTTALDPPPGLSPSTPRSSAASPEAPPTTSARVAAEGEAVDVERTTPNGVAAARPGTAWSEPSGLEMLGRLTKPGKGSAWVRPAAGQVWVAVGLEFLAFEFIQAHALALLQFGSQDLAVALLLHADARFPKQVPGSRELPVLARIELDAVASYRLSTDVLVLDAGIADTSFVLTRSCKLTGDLAVRAWFGRSAHPGDFVFTLGGYHPRLSPLPRHYPPARRVSINWPQPIGVSVTGSAYLAVTPAELMVGGKLGVRWEAGPLSAGFTAEFDALVQWAPLQFDAGVQLTAWAAADLGFKRVSTDVTVRVEVWGPPTGGHASFRACGFHFQVNFGQPRPTPRALKLSWKEFRAQLLPAPTPRALLQALPTVLGLGGPEPPRVEVSGARVLQVVPVAGLALPGDQPDRIRSVPVVSGSAFVLHVRTAIPATAATLNDRAVPRDPHQGTWATHLAVRPMHITTATSTLAITVKRGTQNVDLFAEGWQVRVHSEPVPAALWGSPGSRNDLVPGLGTRVSVIAPDPTTCEGALTVSAAALTESTKRRSTLGLSDTDNPAGPQPRRWTPGNTSHVEVIATGIVDTSPTRSRVYHALPAELRPPDADDGLTRYANRAREHLRTEPMLVFAGGAR